MSRLVIGRPSCSVADVGLAAQLEELLQQLTGGIETEDTAMLANSKAAGFRSYASQLQEGEISGEDADLLCRAIDSAASRLGPVLAALPQRLDPAAPDSAVVHMQHLDAACEVMIACLELAPACGSSSEVQLARTAVEHVLHSGYTALTVWTTCSELCQVCCASLGPQLDLVNQAVHTAGWSATAADEAAQPAQLAAWLAAAVHLLKLMADHCATAPWQRELLPLLMSLCHGLACEPAWEAHAAQLAQPLLAQDIVQLCLSYAGALAVGLSLPKEQRPHTCDWVSASVLSELFLPGAPLHAPLLPHLKAADGRGATAALTAAAQLVQQLPLDQPPAGFSCDEHGRLLAAVAALLATVCSALLASGAIARLSTQQRRQIAKQLLPLTGLPLRLLRGSGGRQGAVAQFQDDYKKALIVNVRFQMDLLVALWEIDSEAYDEAGHQRPAALLPSSSADVAAWCSAACAALQCMPLVQQLHSLRPQCIAQREYAETALKLAWCSISYIDMEIRQPQSAAAMAAADGALHAAVWQLHSRVAQLVHFTAAAEQPLVRLDQETDAAKLLIMLSCGLFVLTELYDLGCRAEGPGSASAHLPVQQLQAMSAAHPGALLVCLNRFQLTQHDNNTVANVLHGLAAAIAYGPLAVGLDPALHTLFDQLWRREALQDRVDVQPSWRHLLKCALRGPCLAALLASGGYLDKLLRKFGQEAAPRRRASSALGTLRAAAAEAVTAASEAAGGGAPAAEEAAAMDRLQRNLQAYDAATSQLTPSLSNLQRQVLPPARQLAAALLDWWRRRSAQQEQQLEAARAAAARSCAYLGCANLGGGGGPAAGEGEGSMRCSACRAVWYCGTACSHADWRAGHKHVCKALGAARAAAKAARRQAAEAAGDADEQPM